MRSCSADGRSARPRGVHACSRSYHAGTPGRIVWMQNLITSRYQNSSTGNPVIQATLAQPGDPARNFSLKDQDDKTFDLYEQAQKRVLLSFHPLAWTDFCAAQMKSLEENPKKFASLNCVPVGTSVDSRPCKQAWAKSLCITKTHSSSATSGRTGRWHRSTGSSGMRTASLGGRISLLMRSRKWSS